MPNQAVVTHGFGFSLGLTYIPTLGLSVPPAPPPAAPSFGGGPSLLPGASPMSLFATPLPIRLGWAALVAASTPYATATVHLYTNDLTPNPLNVLLDFTEADFGGYADVPLVWDNAFIDGENNIVLPADNVPFISTGTPANNIYGYFVKGAAGQLLGAARFANAPIGISGAGYGLDCVPEVIV